MSDSQTILKQLDSYLKYTIPLLANSEDGIIISNISIRLSKVQEYIGHKPDFKVEDLKYTIENVPDNQGNNNEKIS
jgi:hypothetical protein